MEAMMVRQGDDEDRLDAMERAFVALRSELMAEMDRRFDRVDARLDRIEERFERAEERFDARFQSIEARFDAMHRTMIRFSFGMIGVLAATCVSLAASHL